MRPKTCEAEWTWKRGRDILLQRPTNRWVWMSAQYIAQLKTISNMIKPYQTIFCFILMVSYGHSISLSPHLAHSLPFSNFPFKVDPALCRLDFRFSSIWGRLLAENAQPRFRVKHNHTPLVKFMEHKMSRWATKKQQNQQKVYRSLDCIEATGKKIIQYIYNTI